MHSLDFLSRRARLIRNSQALPSHFKASIFVGGQKYVSTKIRALSISHVDHAVVRFSQFPADFNQKGSPDIKDEIIFHEK